MRQDSVSSEDVSEFHSLEDSFPASKAQAHLPNLGFPVEAAFAQLEGYARHLVTQSDDPHCKMQLERVRTAALDLAAAITSDMLAGNTLAAKPNRGRRTSQPALINPSQLDALMRMAGPHQSERLADQLAIDLSNARTVLKSVNDDAAKRDAASKAMSVAESIGAERAARLAQDLLDGVAQDDRRKCAIVAEMLCADMADLIDMLADLAPAANTRPAE